MPLTYASCICQFQSTLPLRGATRLQKQSGMTIKISIHTPLAGSDSLMRFTTCRPRLISIHTPLAGSDPISTRHRRHGRCDFNPHSPCGERRSDSISISTPKVFQSTLPLRGATRAWRRCPHTSSHFNPHSPCGERQGSIPQCLLQSRFQSTLPLRGATAEMRHF